MNLEDVLKILKTAPRSGAEKDKPEGVRYIVISNTLANQMIACLEDHFQPGYRSF